mmetsp:Transcript_36639/g.105430  ORF Transcript_36639/g.105430 Transcript_36639/m.105430 type:complete len:851 (-) Transcript_36639:96-2648(-)
MGNISDITAQVANQCCSEKSAVFTDQKGTWRSPFQGAGEHAAVSAMWRTSSTAPAMKGDMPAVVLVGGTGVGKSNLGNYLLGDSAFESRTSQDSVTAVTQWMDGWWFGGRHPVRVVDCVGIGDTKGAGADQKQWDKAIEVLMQIGKVSVLVLVMRAGRFTKFDKEVVSTLRESFGASFWKNMCVFCTGANAKPGQLDLEKEGPQIRGKLRQIEIEQGADEDALKAINNMNVYAADLDPTLSSPDRRETEFRFKPALAGLTLEELLSLDLRIPPTVRSMSPVEFSKFVGGDAALERWIEGNYYQLGLARLAAFKMDVMTVEPFLPGKLSRLADAPEDEKPPELPQQDEEHSGTAEGTGVFESETEEQPRDFTEVDSLEASLMGGDVVLVKGSWLVSLEEQKQVLPRRQDLPRMAIVDSGALVSALRGSTTSGVVPFIIVVSLGWLSPDHADPDGFHLEQLGPALKAFASWNRASTDDIAVLIDWCSLPQAPRVDDEAVLFKRACGRLHIWYAHALTSKWLLTRVPEGHKPFKDRGWPFFWKGLSSMTNQGGSNSNGGGLVLDLGMARLGWSSWGQVLQDCRVKPAPPTAPEAFTTDLARKAFSNSADRDILARRYAETFRGAIGSAEILDYGGLRWSDREAIRLSKILALCSSLRELELRQNDIGRRGANALAANIGRCFALERLSLHGNCIEEDAQQALHEAWMQAGKPEFGLEIGEQRKAANPMQIITSFQNAEGGGNPPGSSPKSGPMSPTSPSAKSVHGSPTSRGSRNRNPDELTALQMAELGARQAAFEARLHVAINKISSTLSEVGDAVGTPMARTMNSSATLGSATSSTWAPMASPVSSRRPSR